MRRARVLGALGGRPSSSSVRRPADVVVAASTPRRSPAALPTATRTLTTRREQHPLQPPRRALTSFSSDSITYSGGQASEGQGGFYGSGGARVKKEGFEWNSKAVAQLEDINALRQVMDEVATLEETVAAVSDPLSEAVIETKQTIKRLMTQPATVALVEKLEMGGAPVWGLSTSERDLVKDARRKINTC